LFHVKAPLLVSYQPDRGTACSDRSGRDG